MYLLAVVTLIIGLLSIYAQILTVQAARLAANQTGFAQTMMQWHNAALSMAGAIVQAGVYAGPCSLSLAYTASSGLGVCAAPTGGSGGTVTDSTGAPNTINAAGENVHLPNGYKTATYQFYSVMYEDASGTPYVVTFIPALTASYGAAGGGFIQLAGATAALGITTSVTLGDLTQQFKAAGIPDYLYGTTSGGTPATTLQTVGSLKNTLGSTGFSYTLPAAALVPNGTFAVASSPVGY